MLVMPGDDTDALRSEAASLPLLPKPFDSDALKAKVRALRNPGETP